MTERSERTAADLYGLGLMAKEIVEGLEMLREDNADDLAFEVGDKIRDLNERYADWNARRLADWGN